MAAVSIPLLLKDITGGDREVEVAGCTLEEVVAALEARYPGIKARMVNGSQVSPTLAFVVDGRIAASGLATPVGAQSQVNILPAFGGG